MTYGSPRPQGPWFGLAAVVLGLLGCVVPLLPIDLTNIRFFIALPFAAAGFVFAIVGLTGRRRGKALAAVGVVLSLLALTLGMIMSGNRIVHEVLGL
ncbi:hypothetical protein Lesp02_08210 [Lentzea sp. NBRC 105346]|uniref:hypothetical protein n=1 Tax=Lentzea sp. NBRC 105346 TaxID=3032205 RepID=UPI0024A21BA8|nr:hypothetical protein [Lentzea sp. NBRC 105346]GLZ28631.1 hypothetical protein Lesp02_08210 [Lentzea sp. NBRC 105346]